MTQLAQALPLLCFLTSPPLELQLELLVLIKRLPQAIVPIHHRFLLLTHLPFILQLLQRLFLVTAALQQAFLETSLLIYPALEFVLSLLQFQGFEVVPLPLGLP